MNDYSVKATIVKRSAGISAPVPLLQQMISGDVVSSRYWSELILAYFDQYQISIGPDIKDEISLLTTEKYRFIFRLSTPKLILDYRRIKNSHGKPRFSKRMQLIEDVYYPLGIEPRMLAYCCQLLLNKIENNTNSNYYELIKGLVSRRTFELYQENKIKTALKNYFFENRNDAGYSKKLLVLFEAIRSIELQQIIDQRLTVGQEDLLMDKMISTIARTLFKKFFKNFNLVSDQDVEIINEVLIGLPFNRAIIIRNFFGVNEPAVSLNEIGVRICKTRERASQIKNEALVYLKHAKQIKILKEKFSVLKDL